MTLERANEIARDLDIESKLYPEREDLTRPVTYSLIELIDRLVGEGYGRLVVNSQLAAIARYAVDRIRPVN